MSGLALDALRDPRYTGENRCPPCTVVNLVIAAVASLAVAWLSLPAGAAAFAVFAFVIYVKGYLVPGTPELTRRYLPPAVLRLFGKEPATVTIPEHEVGPDREGAAETLDHSGAAGSPESPADDGSDAVAPGDTETVAPGDTETVAPGTADVDPEAVYRDLGIVAEDGDDLRLTDGFAADWHDRMDALAGGDHLDRLAALLGRDRADLSTDTDDGMLVVSDRGEPVVAWPSETALLAVVAAVPALRARHPDWDALHLEGKDRLLNGLLAFVERCPDCDGRVSMTGTEEGGCCTSARLATVACEDCGTVLLRMGV